MVRKIALLCCLAGISNNSVAQIPDSIPQLYWTSPDSVKILPAGKLHVKIINLSGNRKTKTYMIYREIHFKTGDSLTIETLAETLEQARRQVYNLNLFSEVSVTPVMLSANDITVNVTVREKWYVYPTPQFKLVDRNLNEWWKTYNADFNRVVYGMKFVHYNLSGRADQLRIFLLNGYSRNMSFSYLTPASNSKLTEGFRISAGYTQNREIDFKTTWDNKPKQFKKEGFVRNTFNVGVGYQIRKGYFKTHFFNVGYNYMTIYDSIVMPEYNPAYFNSPKPYKGITDFSYGFTYSNTDNINYPLVGKVYKYSVLKRGFGLTGGVNMLMLDGAFNQYFSHFSNKLYTSLQMYGRLKLPFKQPHLNLRALGYGDVYLRGQEYYVIDGVASAVLRYTVKKKIISFNIPVPFNIRAVPRIPFTFFAKTYVDMGYSYIQKQFDTRLNNRFLYTGGFGMDVLTLYDIILNLEFSFNQLGENGVFLHNKGGF